MTDLYTDYEAYLDSVFLSAKSEIQSEAKAEVEAMRQELKSRVEKITLDKEKQIETLMSKNKAEVSILKDEIKKLQANAVEADKAWSLKMKTLADAGKKEVEKNNSENVHKLGSQKSYYEGLLDDKDILLKSEKEKAAKKLSEQKKSEESRILSLSTEHKKEIAEIMQQKGDLEDKINEIKAAFGEERKKLKLHYEGLLSEKDSLIDSEKSKAKDALAAEKKSEKEKLEKAVQQWKAECEKLKKECDVKLSAKESECRSREEQCYALIAQKENEVQKKKQEAQNIISQEKAASLKHAAEIEFKTQQSLAEKDKMHEEYVVTAQQIITSLKAEIENLRPKTFMEKLKLLFS